MSARHRKLDKERFWLRHIKAWQRTSLTIRAYCQLHHISESTFHSWRRLLKKRVAQQSAFVEIVPEQVSPAPVPLELVLPGGFVLRLPAQFDVASLKRLLSLFAETTS